MISGNPAVFISYSEAAKDTVARPFREFINSRGLYGILVGDEPLPDMGAPDPKGKVDYYLNKSTMFVALATPDSKLENGEIQTRQNILLEISSALERPHLKDRVLVFRADGVRLPSNINPVYQALDPDDVSTIFPIFEKQATAWQVLRPLASEEAPVEPSSPESEPPPRDSDSAPTGSVQAAGSLVELSGLVAGEEKENAGAIAARAHLAASTALASLRSSEPLGVHELNGLYLERENVLPSSAELQHLFRTVIANVGAANAPGWFWVKDASSDEVRTRVLVAAMGESDSGAAREAAKLLSHDPVGLSPGQLRGVLRAALKAGESSHGKACLRLLKKQGSRADLRVLASELDAHDDTESVGSARLTIQSREGPQAALRALLTSPAMLDTEIEENLLRSAKQAPRTVVSEALESPAAPVRKLGLQLLDKSSRIKKADVVKLIEDDDDESVRVLAARIAIKRRWRLSDGQFARATEKVPLFFDQNKLGVEFVALKSIEELERGLDWYGAKTYWIYEALARKSPTVRARLSKDLDNDFADLKEAGRQKYEEIIREAVEADLRKATGVDITKNQSQEIEKKVSSSLDKYLDNWSSLSAFFLKRFQIAALSVLADDPGPKDVRFGRRFLGDGNHDIASLAIKILRERGEDSDVQSLVSLASSSWREVRCDAASAALELAREPRSVAFELLDAPNADVVRIALQGLRGAGLDREQIEKIWPLLRNDQMAIRDAATDHIIREGDRQQLQVLLEIYPRDQYYYSVMARVDRALYAPSWVRRSAQSLLDG
ncbi:MAG: hypothetical protein QOE75_2157 [Solirubrobacterales bacterium]|jgi:hypothetical protein|nr:hypothetical protein [Solirubrobacterales bacterium]